MMPAAALWRILLAFPSLLRLSMDHPAVLPQIHDALWEAEIAQAFLLHFVASAKASAPPRSPPALSPRALSPRSLPAPP